MTISPQSVKTLPSRRGFTLLEMVIVLALIGLAMGGAVTLFISTASERKLKEASGDLEVLAKKARMLAIVQQIPYSITFSEHAAHLGPLVEAGYNENDMNARLDLEERAQIEGTNHAKFSPVRETQSLEDFVVSVRRWGAVNWGVMESSDTQVWRFDPNGICEPVGVRYEYKSGWVEMEFHPLSASIREFSMEARK
jgi:prepilin-type N-terminal cleavage/methylation domain-containing protein